MVIEPTLTLSHNWRAQCVLRAYTSGFVLARVMVPRSRQVTELIPHELEHVIERAVALTADPILLVEDLPAKLQGPAPTSEVFPSLEEMEKRHLQLALEKTAGNRRQAAMLLGVSRRTLYRMAKRHGLISENTHE